MKEPCLYCDEGRRHPPESTCPTLTCQDCADGLDHPLDSTCPEVVCPGCQGPKSRRWPTCIPCRSFMTV